MTAELKRKANVANLTTHGAREPSTSPTRSGNAGSSFLKNALEKFWGSPPNPAYPVVNGATEPPQPMLKNFLRDIASQSGRWGADISLINSSVDTKLFEADIVDDRKYQMEQVVQLAASLPAGSDALKKLGSGFISLLWNNLEHPPLSKLGDIYKYRQADGSHNNLMFPDLGKAGESYARTVSPRTLKPGVLPDPGVIFDSLMARGAKPKEHPSKISSMLFYLASIIIHDVFYTDEHDFANVKTSSYLDLSPLYGNNEKDQARVRTFKDGLLKPDCYSNVRVTGFPPGVAAMLICFNRYHNFVAMQLKEINENGRFTPSVRDQDGKKLDNDLFQTARLITCGLYVNIILNDYVRTILALNRTDSTWTLDPRTDYGALFAPNGTPKGIGNQVSVEFNLVYRWHSAISVKDEKWSEDMYRKILGRDDFQSAQEAEILTSLRHWLYARGDDPTKWALDALKEEAYPRNANGTFNDKDICSILTEATEDVACAFGPRQVPTVMKVIEMLGIQQARAWNVATLNEFRKFFKLEPHKTFRDITQDEDVAHALEALYEYPDYVELYPGLCAEDAKEPYEPGSGLCPGYTISRTILADAVALVRGDRFYTIDYSPSTLTNWGFNQVKSDPEVAQGGCIYNLLMRAMPDYYRGNSVYALYPFTVPSENKKIWEKLGKVDQYDFGRPSFVPPPISIKSYYAVTSVLGDQTSFKVPWGPHIFYITGHDYMLSGDKPANAVQKAEIGEQLYCPQGWATEVRKFYEALTTQLIEIRSQKLRGKWYQLDACRDVGNPSHTVFIAQLFGIPLKSQDSINPLAIEVDTLYLVFSILFAFVFLDDDPARSFKLRLAAKTAGDQFAKLMKLVVAEVQAGSFIHLNGLFSDNKILQSYGTKLIERMLSIEGGIGEAVAAIIPTAAAAVATQAQHFAQMLDLYLSEPYSHHWPAIQKLAWSDSDADFELLKSYALEANRLRPASWGLLRTASRDTTVTDNGTKIDIPESSQVYTDFVSAGRDPKIFPNPDSIDLTRDRSLYIHHGFGPHKCLGRPIVEIAMAAQLKVFARLRNLRRAPGPQGYMKSTVPEPNPVSSDPVPAPGEIRVYMKEDWSDWWPFPTTLKVHHGGFLEGHEELLGEKTGVPGLSELIEKARAADEAICPDNA